MHPQNLDNYVLDTEISDAVFGTEHTTVRPDLQASNKSSRELLNGWYVRIPKASFGAKDNGQCKRDRRSYRGSAWIQWQVGKDTAVVGLRCGLRFQKTILSHEAAYILRLHTPAKALHSVIKSTALESRPVSVLEPSQDPILGYQGKKMVLLEQGKIYLPGFSFHSKMESILQF